MAARQRRFDSALIEAKRLTIEEARKDFGPNLTTRAIRLLHEAEDADGTWRGRMRFLHRRRRNSESSCLAYEMLLCITEMMRMRGWR